MVEHSHDAPYEAADPVFEPLGRSVWDPSGQLNFDVISLMSTDGMQSEHGDGSERNRSRATSFDSAMSDASIVRRTN